ncbi:MAG: hypothetical protein QOE46_1130 [Acidobacteriota bacterium]|jgi:hypothetical protein|nr:hypothetical protein [Acidobacteriota bacterium]
MNLPHYFYPNPYSYFMLPMTVTFFGRAAVARLCLFD